MHKKRTSTKNKYRRESYNNTQIKSQMPTMNIANLKKTHETYKNNPSPKINKNDITTPITFNKTTSVLIPKDVNSYVGEPSNSHIVPHENNKIITTHVQDKIYSSTKNCNDTTNC